MPNEVVCFGRDVIPTHPYVTSSNAEQSTKASATFSASVLLTRIFISAMTRTERNISKRAILRDRSVVCWWSHLPHLVTHGWSCALFAGQNLRPVLTSLIARVVQVRITGVLSATSRTSSFVLAKTTKEKILVLMKTVRFGRPLSYRHAY